MAKRKSTRKQTKKPTRLIALVAIFGVATIVAGILTLSPGDETQVDNETLIAEGKTIYDATCVACHGEQGQGHIQLDAPALNGTEHAWHHPDDQIIHVIRNGGTQMPPIGARLTELQVEAVIAYVKHWWDPQQKASQPGNIGE